MNNDKKPSISVIIPARNEEETLELVLRDLAQVLARLANTSEVIVVDDNSSDRTREVAIRRGAKLVSNPSPPGKGYALLAGFRAAKGDYLVMLDADYSHRPEDLPYLLMETTRGKGMVIGSRMLGGSDEYEILRLFGNIFLNFCFRNMFGCFTTDALNGYKVFHREIFTKGSYSSCGFEIEIELLANALRLGYKISEISSHERRRAGGRMKSRTFRDGVRFLWAIIKYGVPYRLYRVKSRNAAKNNRE